MLIPTIRLPSLTRSELKFLRDLVEGNPGWLVIYSRVVDVKTGLRKASKDHDNPRYPNESPGRQETRHHPGNFRDPLHMGKGPDGAFRLATPNQVYFPPQAFRTGFCLASQGMLYYPQPVFRQPLLL